MGNGKQSSWRTSGDWRIDLALIVWAFSCYFIASRVVKPFGLPPTWETLIVGMLIGLGAVVGNRLSQRLLDSKQSGSGS
jgi:hypothetical protein